MQRPSSAALRVLDGSRSGTVLYIEVRLGFKSPILHSKPFANCRKWLFLLELWKHAKARRTGVTSPCLRENARRILLGANRNAAWKSSASIDFFSPTNRGWKAAEPAEIAAPVQRR